jgi:dTDP-L-rhamnose 4-epimerase
VNIHDIVRANLLALERPESNGEIINVGCGKPISILEVAKILSRLLGNNIEPIITHKYRAGDIRHCFADLTKARALLGYDPQVTYEEGFQELAEWLCEQEAEDKADSMLKELNTYGLSA